MRPFKKFTYPQLHVLGSAFVRAYTTSTHLSTRRVTTEEQDVIKALQKDCKARGIDYNEEFIDNNRYGNPAHTSPQEKRLDPNGPFKLVAELTPKGWESYSDNHTYKLGEHSNKEYPGDIDIVQHLGGNLVAICQRGDEEYGWSIYLAEPCTEEEPEFSYLDLVDLDNDEHNKIMTHLALLSWAENDGIRPSDWSENDGVWPCNELTEQITEVFNLPIVNEGDRNPGLEKFLEDTKEIWHNARNLKTSWTQKNDE